MVGISSHNIKLINNLQESFTCTVSHIHGALHRGLLLLSKTIKDCLRDELHFLKSGYYITLNNITFYLPRKKNIIKYQ
jgi:hypothetical protein